eukprot:8618670-Karenia_brevis.AAC.1
MLALRWAAAPSGQPLLCSCSSSAAASAVVRSSLGSRSHCPRHGISTEARPLHCQFNESLPLGLRRPQLGQNVQAPQAIQLCSKSAVLSAVRCASRGCWR